jgi:hypothetical protein
MDKVVAPELPQLSANLIDLLMAVMDAESMVAPAWKTYADSGASHHYFSQQDDFVQYLPIVPPLQDMLWVVPLLTSLD